MRYKFKQSESSAIMTDEKAQKLQLPFLIP
jgi:hypothetical protein